MFNARQHVHAQWTNGNYYGATVVQFNGTYYEVAWDDGSPNLWVTAQQVRPDTASAGLFQVGAHVLAPWTNGQWYGARVVQFNGSHYELAWDDGSPNLWVGADQVRAPAQAPPVVGDQVVYAKVGYVAPVQPAAPSSFGVVGGNFPVGAPVLAQWSNGQMYGARVVQFNGTYYEVAWDDGSPNLWVASAQVQARPLGPGQPVMARWTNGNDYPATVVRQEGPGYEVAWADGSPNLWVEHQYVRQVS